MLIYRASGNTAHIACVRIIFLHAAGNSYSGNIYSFEDSYFKFIEFIRYRLVYELFLEPCGSQDPIHPELG